MNQVVKRSLKQTFDFFYKYYILIFIFDRKFYIACNPDVAIRGINARNHFRKYGFLEERVFSVNECDTVLIEDKNLSQFQSMFDVSLADSNSSYVHLSMILLPWRIGCWGRPFKFIRVRISNFSSTSKTIINASNLFYTKKGFFETIYFLKY